MGTPAYCDTTQAGQRIYMAIGLRSFFASIEARERGLDPMNTNLATADETRTEKTVCLAVPPALKTSGVPGRPYLLEIVAQVKAVNRGRARRTPRYRLMGSSYYLDELQANSALVVDCLVARPRIKLYMETSAAVFSRYLRWVSPTDVHAYSIDEMFINVTGYLEYYRAAPVEPATELMYDIHTHAGITATVGIGENLYLVEITMSTLAKHAEADEYGVCLVELTMRTYREQLWMHRPLMNFWRVGPTTARKLEAMDLSMTDDVARVSLGERYDRASEEALYRISGVNAELLIDHAWGWGPTTIADAKSYHPQAKSVNVSQALPRTYESDEARMIMWEMADGLSPDLVDKGLTTDQAVLIVGYDIENLVDPARAATYRGKVKRDHYGRLVLKPIHGNGNLGRTTISTQLLLEVVTRPLERIVDPEFLVRRMYMSVSHIRREEALVSRVDVADTADGSGAVGGTEGFVGGEPKSPGMREQLDLFTDYEASAAVEAVEQATLAVERRNQEALLWIKRKFGKNAVFRGASLLAGATALDHNWTAGGYQLRDRCVIVVRLVGSRTGFMKCQPGRRQLPGDLPRFRVRDL